MSQYADLDSHILSALKGALGHTFTMLLTGGVRAEATRLAEATGGDAFRILYRRLQALRKAGKIAYSKGAWRLIEGGAEG